VQIWGNGQLLTSKEVAPGGAFEWLTAPLPADHGHGVNIDVLGDYVLAPGDRPALGRSGQTAPADIALTITPKRTRIQVNSHTWIGEKGYTVVALDPESRLIGIRAFNTSWSEDDSHALAAYLGGLPRGTVVAVATFFDASRSLTDDAVRALAGIGLTGDLRGHFGWAQAGIGVAGAAPGTAVESTGESSAECRVGQPAGTTVELEEVRLE
jgi:interleukin-like EMT inducer protein